MGVVIRPMRMAGRRGAAAVPPGNEEEEDPIIGWRVPDDSCWRVEKLAVEMGEQRLTLELGLAGAILKHPRIGMLRANELGVMAGHFEREDARCMYLAAAYCHQIGRAEEDGLVLYLARHALQRAGFWDDQAKAFERGMKWSLLNLVDMAWSTDGPGDVIEYAKLLFDLDRHREVASRLWKRLFRVLDDVGKWKVGSRQKDEG